MNMFPVYMKTAGSEPPKEYVYYIIAQNGIFLRKKMSWCDAIVSVRQISVLEPQIAGAIITVPPISARAIGRALKFFRTVDKLYDTEAAVLLHFSEEHGWNISVPVQTTTSVHVDYEMTERIPGFSLIGTMHSHPGFGAFHSSVDVPDEAAVDGFHITFGDIRYNDTFTMDAEIVINGNRLVVPVSHLEGIALTPGSKYETHWKIKPRYTHTYAEIEQWEVPLEWLEKVKMPAPTVFTPTAYGSERNFIHSSDENPYMGIHLHRDIGI